MESDKLRYKFEKSIFEGLLTKLSKKLPEFSEKIYICFAKNSADKSKIADLYRHLYEVGISSDNIFYSEVNTKYSIYQFEDIALRNSTIALIIGCSNFIKTYNDHSDFLLDTSLTYIYEKIPRKIPLTFENDLINTLPLIYQSFPGLSFNQNYYLTFFDLLICLYKLDPINNVIHPVIDTFKRSISDKELFNKFKAKIEADKEEDKKRIKEMFGL